MVSYGIRNARLVQKERKVQEENNGQHVRYLIREWKVYALSRFYLPTYLAEAFNTVQVIAVARTPYSTITFTNNLDP